MRRENSGNRRSFNRRSHYAVVFQYLTYWPMSALGYHPTSASGRSLYGYAVLRQWRHQIGAFRREGAKCAAVPVGAQNALSLNRHIRHTSTLDFREELRVGNLRYGLGRSALQRAEGENHQHGHDQPNCGIFSTGTLRLMVVNSPVSSVLSHAPPTGVRSGSKRT